MMPRPRKAARAIVGMAALGAAASCNVVFGIEQYEAGPPDEGGSPEDVSTEAAPHDSGLSDAGGPSDVHVDTHTNACTAGQKQCSGNGVETCNGSGQYGMPAPCGGKTPYCYKGSCTATPPSCAPGGNGMDNCGESVESCCTSLEVDGGMYSRTYFNAGSGATGKADPATVSSFQLDKYLVTVGRFRQFVNAWNGGSGFLPAMGSGKHTHLNGGSGLANSSSPGSFEPGWVATDDMNIEPSPEHLACDPNYPTWTPSPGNNENLPINCVTWAEAYAFCIFDGGFLPSEAEWEFAAAGGNALLEYPWGSTPPGKANEYAIYGCDYPSGSGSCSMGVKNIAPVGTATEGAGTWGQLDLAGDVLEWTIDWEANYVDPCHDCAYLKAATGRVVRGGYFTTPISMILPTSRALFTENARHYAVGLRCAKAP